MTDSQDSEKARRLAALRVWRAYMDNRDPLIRDAREADASIAEIMEASGLAKNTVRAALAAAGASHQEDAMPTTTDHLGAYHHPHFISATTKPRPFGGGDDIDIAIRPFTGVEPEPVVPDLWSDTDLSDADRQLLAAEYQVLRRDWGKAKLRMLARPALQSATPAWQKYRTARATMDAAFEKFWTGNADGQWKSQVLHLLDAQEATARAAQEWDDIAVGLARIERDHGVFDRYTHYALRHAASDLGMDIADWDIRDLDDYTSSWGTSRLANTVNEEIQRQKARLKEVADLTGDSTHS